MPMQLSTEDGGRVLIVQVSGILSVNDYELLIPEVDRLLLEHNRINVLFNMRDFHGWTSTAMWEDTKFGLRHYHDIERLAVVGQNGWEEGVMMLLKPFMRATLRYFEDVDYQKAMEWLHELHPIEV